ncbi:TNF receptor-associated factor 1 isoform X2 [Scleropages formosus]|uniref:TNF receptor-associated factor 1 isoform X2 n=1 Tax=Scleropages formosus TaxID=113540 RepID=UPI000877EE5D|nr:TNF receptor-associated factor 1 isoform X2 [Scleropages formosus]
MMAERATGDLDGVLSAPGENEYPSGFPQSICDDVPQDKYLCSNCSNVLNKARQTMCGHRYCLACVNWLVRNNKNLVCKKCKEEDPNLDSANSILTPENKHTCQNSAREKKAVKAEKKEKNSQPSGPRKKENCSFAEVGCSFKGNTEKVKEHEGTSHVVHLQLLLQVTRNLQASIMGRVACGHLPELGEAMAGLQLQGSSDVEVDGGDGGHEEASVAHSLQDDQAASLLVQRLEELQQRVHIYENIITVLNREVEKTQLSVAMLDQQNQSNREIIQHLENQVTEQQRNLVMKDVLLSSLRQRITAQEEVSHDGTLLWKVCDLNQKMKEAASGRRNNHYSPAFYTSRYGFKVCMRLYLNGDGVGKGTHISLFFVVMKGEYDALLSWPFRHKVTFFLLDQNQKEHVIDAFRPDLSSSSFQRPVTDMNVASGCPLFFPLAKLRSTRHAYCKDDTLFIKCVVDTTS